MTPSDGIPGGPLTPTLILRLQRLVGNQAVLRLLRGSRPEPPVKPEPRPVPVAPKPGEGGSAKPPGVQVPAPPVVVKPRAPDPEVKPPEVAKPKPKTGPLPKRKPEPERPEAGDGAQPPADLARLRQAAAEATAAGCPDVARAIAATARALRKGGTGDSPHTPPARRVWIAALRLWEEARRAWGCGPLWRRVLAWLAWILTFGRCGGPWLVLSAPQYARIPYWRRKDAGFVAEVVDQAHGPVLTPPHPPDPDEWADLETEIDGFAASDRPLPGCVWSDGSRCGVVLGGAAGVWVGLAPSLGPGDGWGEWSGLTVVCVGEDAVYRGLTEEPEAGGGG